MKGYEMVETCKNGYPQGHVFIVTYGRSGSTLLQKVLNSIEGYQIRGENNNALFHLVQSWHAIKTSNPMSGMRRSGRVSGPDHPWYGAENTLPDRYGKMLAEGFTREILAPSPGIRVLGFKEIRFANQPNLFTAYLDFLHKFFRNSKFVFNLRNHDNVINSAWWKEMDPETARQQLERSEKLFKSYLERHPDRGTLVNYDDYVANPNALRPLFYFLGESFDEIAIRNIMSVKLNH